MQSLKKQWIDQPKSYTNTTLYINKERLFLKLFMAQTFPSLSENKKKSHLTATRNHI